MTRIITITGGKGGVGKTNISINLALCLSKLGSKVCLFDADLGLANINILLGLYPEYDLEDVISHNKSIQDIIIKDYQGIDIIPGSSGVEKLANLEQENTDRIIQSFSELDEYDFFIFDTSSGISRNVISFCLAASEVVLVITPEPTSLTDAYALLKVLCYNRFDGSAKIVVNQCKNTTIASHTYNKFKAVVQKYLTIDIVPLGIIIQDKKFPEAVKKQQPLIALYPKSSASKCISVMASRLIADEHEDFKPLGITSFWTKFLEFTKSPLNLTEKAETEKEDYTEATEMEKEKKYEKAAEKEKEEIIPDESNDNLSHAGSAEGKAISPLPESFLLSDTEDISKASEGKQLFFIQDRGKNKKHHPLFDKIEFSRNLPTLPHILLKLIETCNREDTSIKDLGEIVGKDPSLCTKILRLVNSAYYNLPQKVQNFNQALSLLGTDTIRNIAVSASVTQVFNGLKEDSVVSLKQFWWHSLMCACLGNLIARKISYPMPEEAFLSGLLHDIGKLVLMENYPKEYSEIVKSSKNNTHLFTKEQQQLGITHCETGAWLINHWHLQSFIADAILYHHEPPQRIVNALPLVKIICVANGLCSYSNGEKGIRMAEEIFGFKSTDIEEIVGHAEDQVNQIAQSLDIDIESPQEIDSSFSDRDREIQADLKRQVRDMSLLQGTLQNLLNAHDVNSILKVAQQGLQILFDIKNILFFLYDQSQNVLIGTGIENNLTNELTIQFQEGKSMLVKSLQQASICNSFSHGSQFELTIIDEQLIRLLGKEGIICLPMVSRKQYVGVVVLGVDEANVSEINNHVKLLSMFINYTAFALHAENVRQTQAKLVLSERLAASTAMARKVSHEVNNPLSIIKNYLKLLEINLSEQNVPNDELKIINEEINHVALIIDELSDFSGSRTENPEPVDLNALLTDIVKITSGTLFQNKTNVHLDLDSTLPCIVTGKKELKQVFINLIKNADEAFQDGGNIYISTKHSVALGSAEITVSDDGPGLPDIIKSRLFEPYISTKGKGHTGLGLSIVYSTIKELKGSITCKTEKGKGTSFNIVLPIKSDNKL